MSRQCAEVTRQTEDGAERRCPKCAEYWPADLEFFHSAPRSGGGLSSWCKACYADDRNARRHPTTVQGQAARPDVGVASIFAVTSCA